MCNSKSLLLSLLTASAIVSVGVIPVCGQPVTYDITWLNTDDAYDDIWVNHVDRQGTTIVGDAKNGTERTAVTIDVASGAITDLNSVAGKPAGWHLGNAYRITSSGKIAGTYSSNSGPAGLYIYDAANAFEPFRTVDAGSEGINLRDMNDAGDLLYVQAGIPYIYDYELQESLALPQSLVGELAPRRLNDVGLVTGNIDSGTWTAYVHDVTTGTTTMIPPFFEAYDINNHGAVIGRGALTGKGKSSSYTQSVAKYSYLEGTKSLLTDNLGSVGKEINDAGQAVGYDYDPGTGKGRNATPPHYDFFLYDPSAGFWELSDLIDDPQDEGYWYKDNAVDAMLYGVYLSEPLELDGYPLIVGREGVPGSMFPDGVDRNWVFILSPITAGGANTMAIPEPSSLGLLTVLAVVGLTLGRARCSAVMC